MSTILKALERVEEERRIQDAGGPAPAVAESVAGGPSSRSVANGPIAHAGGPFDPRGLRESRSWSPLWTVGIGVVLTLAISWYSFRDDSEASQPEVAMAQAPAEGALVAESAAAANAGSSLGDTAVVGPLAAEPPLAELPASFPTELERSPSEPSRSGPETAGPPGQGENAPSTRRGRGLPRPRPTLSPAPPPAAEVAGTPTQETPPVAATPGTSPPPPDQAELPAAADPALLAAGSARSPEPAPAPARNPAVPQGFAPAPPLPGVASQPPTYVATEAIAKPEPAMAKVTPSKPKVRVASVPRAPKVTVEQTVWHPKPERRSARVVVAGMKGPLELKEGDAVGVLVVAEIKPSSVVFLHGANRIKRRVGR